MQQNFYEEGYRKILQNLRKDKFSVAFREPVDWQACQLWDYPDKIKTPMDLGTMSKKVHLYASPDEFFADLQLIWQNCKIYNMEGSDIYVNAEYLENKSLELKKKYIKNPKKKEKQKEKEQIKSANLLEHIQEKEKSQNIEKPKKSMIQVEQKLNVAFQAKNCTDDQMVMFIKTILEQCPYALKGRNDTLDINVSNLDQQTAQNCEKVFKDENGEFMV